MDYGTLRVATPDGQIREYPIDTPTAIIGRAEGNQVVVDHVSVSRRHAQLVIESARVTIEDLGSGTGTFVGSQRIPANTPTLVESGQSMRFGEAEARFTFSEALAPADPGVAAAESRDSEQTIGVALTSPSQPIAAGSPTTATVNIQNRGTVVDEVTISIIDLPEGWAKVSRPTLSLVPGARDEITVVIQPPKDSTAAAGDYPFSVRVTSKVNNREVRALGKLTVLAFEGFRITMQPARSTRDFKVALTNDGNVTTQIGLTARDEAGEFTYEFDSNTVELGPGEEKRVGLAVKPKSRKLLGQSMNRPFRVEARQGASGTPLPADGTLTIVPPLERFRWPLYILGGLIVAAILGFVGNSLRGGGSSKADTDPTPTTAAVASPTKAQAQATATPTGLYVGGNGLIQNSDPNPPTNTNCLAVRSSATREGDNILGRLCTGEKVAIKGGPTAEGGFTWWQIQSANGLAGWAAEKSADGATPFIVPTP